MQQWEKTYEIIAGGSLVVDQKNGTVRITGSEEQMVKVQATSADEDLAERIEAESGERGVRVVVIRRQSFLGLFGDGERVDLTIQVPYGTPCKIEIGSGPVEVSATLANVGVESGSGPVRIFQAGGVTVESGSGSVHVGRASGGVKVEGGSGSIELEEIAGPVSVEVGSGSVTVRSIAGDLAVETGSGRLTVTDVVGSVDLESGSGSAAVHRVRGPRLRLEASSGTVELTSLDVGELVLESGSGRVGVELLKIHPGGSYKVEAGSGGVSLALPADADLKLHLEAHSGRITHTGLDLKVIRSERREMEAVLGEGGAALAVTAGGGPITLRAVGGETVAPPAPKAPVPPVAPPAPSKPVSGLIEVINQDAALSSSEHVRWILDMVEQGKLSPEEAEALLRALDEDEEAPA